MRTGLALVAAVWLAASTSLAGAKGKQGKTGCEAARCAVQATIDGICGCDSATNHGAHVGCVAHALKRLARDGLFPQRCTGSTVRCAARSACGRRGAVACSIPVSACDAVTRTCANDATAACANDGDCGVRCRIAPSAAQCQATGGAVRAGPNCCEGCGSPSGAFVGEPR